MIIENGYIQIVTKSGGGMKDGMPVSANISFSKVIPCNIQTIKHDKKGFTENSTYIQLSYQILVDEIHIDVFNAESVIIIDNRRNRSLPYYVQDVQHLDCVQAIKIVV